MVIQFECYFSSNLKKSWHHLERNLQDNRVTLATSEGEPRVRVGWGKNAIRLLDDRWDSLVFGQRLPNPTLSATWLREKASWDQSVPLVIVVEAGDRLAAGGAFGVLCPAGP